LQQILIHLLQNAGSTTPIEGTIRLKVQTTNVEGHDYVMIQVTDSGGGIPEEDLPRVFTRLYRADNVLIQGVGDTGVGLSIAKTLTEAQHGRIWVESEAGVGATFNVLLPIVKDTADSRSKKENK
jgi:two-component system phosphate regulon sensor histidine kinase PhoR